MKRQYLLLAFMITGCCTPQVVTKIEVRERVDSVFIPGAVVTLTAPSDTVVIAQTDSALSIHASIDTTVSGVRMNLHYRYPPDSWNIDLSTRDTVVRYIARDSIIQTPYEVIRERVPFWMYVTLAGMVLALLACIIRR